MGHENRSKKRQSRTDLAHETSMNPFVQQQFAGCFAEQRQGPVKHLTCQGLKHSLQMDALYSDGDKVD